MNMISSTAKPRATLANLLAAISASPRLNDTRRRDLTSAIYTVARWLNRRPAEISADARDLRQRLAHVHPTQVGISQKRFNNVMSDFNAALKCLAKQPGIRVRVRHRPEMAEWQTFRTSLETDWQRHM